MVDREIAYRMFAKELNDSSSTIHSTVDEAITSDGHTPNYLLTPGGVMVNRVFVTGVLTEVDNVGSDVGTWRARVVDPSGAFTVYAGQYQSDAATFLSSVEPPEYVSIVGKVRSYKPDDGPAVISLRPEEINLTDEDARNRWILDTAELTLDRLDAFSKILLACGNIDSMDECMEGLGVAPVLSEGIGMAIRHYGIDENYLNEIRSVVKKCIVSLDLLSDESDEKDIDTLVLEIMNEFDKGKGVDYAELLSVAVSRQLNERTVDSAVRSLLAKGQCYEPKAGILKLIS
ncbi:RPA family protein [Methanococcoides alaskense]|uniref:RPA family protein n=1 Tax=Methanococcoides alaskense TaxID=325778 RepID=A0AA90TXU9_9EURY|nr:DNA-binding protein [Methanococcoides alaskense]MDA0525055.1 DNA-binding protein [Methanococcoides alaskense]MDR6222029.1 RPA family protein [Methanococcoides alaskense]